VKIVKQAVVALLSIGIAKAGLAKQNFAQVEIKTVSVAENIYSVTYQR